MGSNRGRLPPTCCQPHSTPCDTAGIGRPEKNERPHPPAGREDTQSIIMSPGSKPADLGKPGCLGATSATASIKSSPDTRRDTNQELHPHIIKKLPARNAHDLLPCNRVKG